MKYYETPQDIQSEQAILSLLIFSPERFVEVVDLLKVEDFYDSNHQAIWQAMIELFREGNELDLIAIRSQIKKNNTDSGPIFSALLEAYEHTVLGGNLLHFVKIIKNKSILRKSIRVLQSQTYNAQLENAEADKILSDTEKELLDVADSMTEAKRVDAEGIIIDLNEEITDIQKRGRLGVPTGFKTIDAQTGGLIPTQSWIVGAYTGVGKTFFILQTILNVLREGGKVILFSTEMDRKMNMLRLIGNISGSSPLNILRGNLLETEVEDVRKAQEELQGYKDQLTIYDNIYTVAEMRLKAKKAKITHGLDLVAIDFIQNLRGKESIYERMSEAAVSLQQLGQELEVTMMIGSQVSQNAAGWQSKEAIEFKGAGEIAAIADVAVWLKKTKEGKNAERQIVMRKVRHGSPGLIDARLDFPSGRFYEIDLQTSEQEDNDDVKSQI